MKPAKQIISYSFIEKTLNLIAHFLAILTIIIVFIILFGSTYAN